MTMQKLSLIAVVAVSLLLFTGCAQQRTPWDPPAGRALFEQIPNWDGEAGRRCGGHLPPEVARREGRSLRC
jgi:hypothetical protein